MRTIEWDNGKVKMIFFLVLRTICAPEIAVIRHHKREIFKFQFLILDFIFKKKTKI